MQAPFLKGFLSKKNIDYLLKVLQHLQVLFQIVTDNFVDFSIFYSIRTLYPEKTIYIFLQI